MRNAQHIFPDLSAGMEQTGSEEPVILNGMEVLFDIKVGLYPVNLAKKEKNEAPGIRKEPYEDVRDT